MDDKEEWRRLADDLGFEFKDGIKAFIESPSLAMMAAGSEMKTKDVEQAKKLLGNSMVQGLLSKIFMGAAAGFYRDCEFALFRSTTTTNNNVHRWVNIALFFRKDLRCGMEISHAGPIDRFLKAVFRGSYVRIPNNPELDRVVSIKATNKNQAKVLMADRDIQEVISRLYGESKAYKVSDHGIRYKESGHIIDKNRALEIMDNLVDAAEKFGAVY